MKVFLSSKQQFLEYFQNPAFKRNDQSFFPNFYFLQNRFSNERVDFCHMSFVSFHRENHLGPSPACLLETPCVNLPQSTIIRSLFPRRYTRNPRRSQSRIPRPPLSLPNHPIPSRASGPSSPKRQSQPHPVSPPWDGV